MLGDQWSEESHNLMDTTLTDGCLCTFLARHNDTYLVDISHGDGVSLMETLVNASVAKPSRKSSQISDHSHSLSATPYAGFLPSVSVLFRLTVEPDLIAMIQRQQK